MPEEYLWVINPEGRKVEIEKARLKELMERGFKLSDSKDSLPVAGEYKEYLDVIEI
jgi:hypothetical protein